MERHIVKRNRQVGNNVKKYKKVIDFSMTFLYNEHKTEEEVLLCIGK